MKPTLLILAAGMGSRYGGLKQLDPVGPNGEVIMDYSVYDAVKAGFGKVVFVIRHDFEDEFKNNIGSKYSGLIDVQYAFQELNDLPDGFSIPEGRIKPWGTSHAILVAKNMINEPFCVINADDFYGREAYMKISEQLSNTDPDTTDPQSVRRSEPARRVDRYIGAGMFVATAIAGSGVGLTGRRGTRPPQRDAGPR